MRKNCGKGGGQWRILSEGKEFTLREPTLCSQLRNALNRPRHHAVAGSWMVHWRSEALPTEAGEGLGPVAPHIRVDICFYRSLQTRRTIVNLARACPLGLAILALDRGWTWQ